MRQPAVVHLPRSLVALFPGAPRRIEVEGATVAEIIIDLDGRIPGIRNRSWRRDPRAERI